MRITHNRYINQAETRFYYAQLEWWLKCLWREQSPVEYFWKTHG